MIRFKDIEKQKGIIGLPESANISSHIPAKDFIDDKIITVEDVNDGVIYLVDCGFTKISNLVDQGIDGFDNGNGEHPASLYNIIKFNHLSF